MADDVVLNAGEIAEQLTQLPGWELRDGWIRRTYNTPGWPHTMLLVNTIGYLAEAAWHHPDLRVGYAKVTVLLQTHRVGGITMSDIELAKKIDQTAVWLPEEGTALDGYQQGKKRWVH